MTIQNVTHQHHLEGEINVSYVVKLATGFIVEHQRGAARSVSTLKTEKHAVLDIDEAFTLARELMDAPSDDEDGEAT